MQTNERTAENGGIFISNDVIASIAANAAKDIEGVSGFAVKTGTRTAGAADISKAVKVLSQDNDVKIQIGIRVKNGVNLQTVSMAIQRSIKNAVQSMTGKVVTKVNVAVQGIDFDAPNEVKADS
ncbi:MAG: Asp23/Gls24 family envelope stress response protein [Candidatus Fimenecus sp.]|nr:Asp23/Gls24 family envelope stress response protein [Clostridia bacterium]